MNKVKLFVVTGIILSFFVAYFYPLGGDDYPHVLAAREIAKKWNFGQDTYGNCSLPVSFYPPLWHLLMAMATLPFLGSFSQIFFAIKTIQAIIGTLLIASGYLIFNKVLDRKTKPLALIFLSLFIVRIMYSGRAYVDILVALLVSLSVFAYLKWKETPSLKNSIFLAIFGFLSALTHFYALLIFPFLFLNELTEKKKKLIAITAISLLASAIPLYYIVFESPLLSPQSDAKSAIFSGGIDLMQAFYETWLGGPNFGEQIFRSNLFERGSQIFGFNIEYLWVLPAAFLTLVLLFGLKSAKKWMVILMLIFLPTFFVKGLIRMFLIPSIIPLSVIFAYGWNKLRKFDNIIFALLLVFALQSIVFSLSLYSEKNDYNYIFERAKEIVPKDAKVVVFGDTELSRVSLMLDRNAYGLGVGPACIKESDVKAAYLFLDNRCFEYNRCDIAAIERLATTSTLLNHIEYGNSWANIYYRN